MGKDLVMRVIAVRPMYSHVSPRAYLVLLRMAATAFDHDEPGQPAREYFAGHRPLAMMLGYKLDDGAGPMPKTAENAVGVVIAELVDTGLITRSRTRPYQGVRNRVYVIRA